MSKSKPEDAIFLTDDSNVVKNKIKRAQTATAGNMSESLESHMMLIKSICYDVKILGEIDSVINDHMNSLNVMGTFKKIFTDVVINFLSDFQSKRQGIIANKEKYLLELQLSSKIAISRAEETMKIVSDALGM